MQIGKDIHAVQRIFKEIDKSTRNFLGKVEVSCPKGCNKCCHGKKVAAVPLEFLPYANHLYQTGELENKYWEFKSKEVSGCFLVEDDEHSLNGKCSMYDYRGAICRLFGNCANIHKNGEKQFSACAILKSQIIDKEKFNSTLQLSAPIYSNYYMKLRAIDPTNGAMMFPINIAILKAMELVYNNTRGHRKPVGLK